jgi:hypothetical protein
MKDSIGHSMPAPRSVQRETRLALLDGLPAKKNRTLLTNLPNVQICTDVGTSDSLTSRARRLAHGS